MAAIRLTTAQARKTIPSALRALKQSEPERLSEIRSLKQQIKKLLKRGEAVYVEHSATYGNLI